MERNIATPAGLQVQVESSDQNLVQAATIADITEQIRAGSLTRSTVVHRSFVAPAAEIVPSGFTIVRSDRRRWVSYAYAVGEGAALIIHIDSETTDVDVYAVDDDRLVDVATDVTALISAHEPPESEDLDIRVWAAGYHGFETLTIPQEHWAESRRNYAGVTAGGLDPLMRMTERPTGGKLLLWYGAPGTGKSHAVTSLASEWSTWCEPHLVTDAETFFTDPSYLRAIVNDHRSGAGLDLPHGDEAAQKGRSKLVICEDADEYLRSDARERSGPALGRLLNLTDGLYGRNRDCYVLLTTNDDITRLHPAVVRPGRCLSQVEFAAMSVSESRAWAGNDIPTRPMTLAELYALDGDSRIETTTERIGAYL